MTQGHSIPQRYVLVSLIAWLICILTACRVYKASPQVAFLGDSLTEGWTYPSNNFGVFGNTTAQIKARLPGLMAGRRFKFVVILGGTNDVLVGTDANVTVRNLEDIATSVVKSGAEPVLCEIPPIFHNYKANDNTDYSNPVRILNARIVQLAATHKWRLIDYYDPILGHPDYSTDGVHMRRRGYAVMEAEFLREVPTS